MKRADAEALLKELVALYGPFNRATDISMLLQPEDGRRVRAVLGEVMGNVYTELMLPIIREYPDLDPDAASLGER